MRLSGIRFAESTHVETIVEICRKKQYLWTCQANGMPDAVQQIELVHCRELLSIAEKDKRSFSS